MKIASFSVGQEAPQLGVVRADRVVPLSSLVSNAPIETKDLISRWDDLKAKIAAASSEASGLALSAVRLHAPLTHPEKIFCIGMNYADHVAEVGAEVPTQQVWFAKHNNCLTGPHDPVQIPRVSTMIDYEVELVAVIGKRCKHVSREAAAGVVFGYCVGNDVTTRDWQRHTRQWTLGKSFDTHGPIGPWITTADEVGDPHTLNIRCLVNGEVRQSSNTSNLIFDAWAQIEHLSKVMTLEPGDLIFTGTCGGVGSMMKPPRFLAAGDVVRCEIDKLGSLENPMAAEG